MLKISPFSLFVNNSNPISLNSSRSKSSYINNTQPDTVVISFKGIANSVRQLQKVNNTYQNVINIPYSTVPMVYRLAHEKHLLKYKDTSCLGLSEILKSRLNKQGFKDIFFIRSNRHHALILKNNNEVYLLDPYLLHKEPINLTKILDSKQKKEKFEAYPLITTPSGEIKPSYLTVRCQDPNIFSVEKGRYNCDLAKYQVTKFSFNIQNAVRNLGRLDMKKLLYDPEQTSLSIRFLDKANMTLTHLVYPINKAFPDKIIDKKLLFVKTNEGKIFNYNDKNFDENLEKMSNQLECTTESLIDFMIQGVKDYFREAPAQLKFYSKNPVNN